MKEVVSLHSRDDLVKKIADDMDHWYITVKPEDVKIEPYGFDDRIGWDTYVVLMRNLATQHGVRYFGSHMDNDYFGVVGFTNGSI